MTHAEFECHFATQAEKFGIAKLIRENNEDYSFQSFMLALSGIVARDKPISEEELDELAMIKYPCNCSPDEKYCDCCINPDLKEAYKEGCKEILKRL